MKEKYIVFIPMIESKDESLEYFVELFDNYNNLDHLIILMPLEFSIKLELDPEEMNQTVADPVLLSFYDLLETFEELKSSKKISIYHEKQIDELGGELESIIKKFWDPMKDAVLNEIHTARKFYDVLKSWTLNPFIEENYKKFYYKQGLVDFDLDDSLQKPIIDRLIEERKRKNQFKRKTLKKISPYEMKMMEEKMKLLARETWKQYLESGKLKYHPPKVKL